MHCAVIGCPNKRRNGKSWFRIPSDRDYNGVSQQTLIDRQNLWIHALNRYDLCADISKFKCARVCSDHFVYGKPSKNKDEADYVPNINLVFEETPESNLPTTEGVRFTPIPRSSSRCCCVPNCSSRSKATRSADVRLHQFPKPGTVVLWQNELGVLEQTEKRNLWIKLLKLDKEPNGHTRVCSLHFTIEDYILAHASSKKPCLKSTANPSQNLPTSEDVVKNKKLSKNKKNVKNKASTSGNQQSTDRVPQENSSHIEQIYIKEEPMETDNDDSKLHQELRDPIKTEPVDSVNYSESYTINSRNDINIDSISTNNEHVVNIKKECSDNYSENQLSVLDDIVKTEPNLDI